MKHQSDIIEQLKKSDRSTFRAFVDENKTKVIRICMGFVRNIEDAEDIAQEVFTEVFLSIKRFRSDANINTWLYRIAVNKSLDFLRKKKRKKRAGKLLSIFGITVDTEPALKVYSNPEIIYEKNEKYRRLLKAIDSLPENQRAALLLNKFDDLSYKEIAEVLGTSDSAVDSLIQRAKKKLKKILISEDI